MWLVFKLVILVLLSYFIYHTLANNSELSITEFQKTLSNSKVTNPFIALILIAFTGLNWTLEIAKWKILASKIKPISFNEAVTQSLASHSFALITPNRIGEYGAKALFYKKANRKSVVLQNFVGNFYQLFVTMIIGYAGIYYLSDFTSNIYLENTYHLVILGTFVFCLLILFRHKLSFFNTWLRENFIKVNIKEDGWVLLLSLVRYLIFSHQFYFLVTVFDVEVSYIICMSSIAAMYFIASVIPMLSIFDFVVKGSVAVFVFSFLSMSPLIVLTITTLMWLFNFVLPAIIGSYFVLKFKPVTA